MAEKMLETDDPYAMIAQRVPAPAGTDPDAAMARVFIEEYALMGFTPAKILRLFQAARFEGTRRILDARGEDFVRQLIEGVFGVRSLAGTGGYQGAESVPAGMIAPAPPGGE